MKYIIAILLLVFKFSAATAQEDSLEIKEMPMPKGNSNCVYKPVYSIEKRKQFYPFNIADTVKLVSFRYHRNNYPIDSNKLVTDSLIEIKLLNSSAINKLTDILYNNFYKDPPNYGSISQCFFPRNAILFIDKNGKLRESILICFHCSKHEESSGKVKFGSNCRQKMEKIRQFFITNGIKMGTDKSINECAGEEDSDENIIYPPK